MTFDPLILINCRDRVTPLRKLVAWLERAGHQRIVLLDNASTWEPLLEFYRETPHDVVYLGENVGARGLWTRRLAPSEWFVYTDPDVVPMDECPLDAVAHFKALLDRYGMFRKAGFGLYLEDLPAHCPSLGHERSLMHPGPRPVPPHGSCQLEPGVFQSAIDTTFALCRPDSPFDYYAIRTGMPYMARHDCPSWYRDRPLTDEDRYYLANTRKDSEGSSWANSVVAG